MRNWRRYEEAKLLRDTDLTLAEVGSALGVSAGRVREMLKVIELREIQLAREAENPSIVPWWRGLTCHTQWALEMRGFDSRDACMRLAADDLTIFRGAVALPGWEADKAAWRWSYKRLKLSTVNEVRAWLGVPPCKPSPRVAIAPELVRLRHALSQIAAIESEQFGSDWCEIEHARKIAVAALGPPNVGDERLRSSPLE